MHELYIANKNYSSWSLRPWLLMKMLDIPFQESVIDFNDGVNQGLFRRFSPTGKVPCLVDQTLTVWDSLAISEYLAEIHPTVWPGRLEARTWARCATAEMHSGFTALREQCTMNCGMRVTMGQISPELQKDIDRLNSLWEDGLQRFGGPFLAGKSFTAVDAFFAPVAFRIQTYALPLTEAASHYVQHLLALEPMQQWYNAALAETWRIEKYDAITRNAGNFIADYRTHAL